MLFPTFLEEISRRSRALLKTTNCSYYKKFYRFTVAIILIGWLCQVRCLYFTQCMLFFNASVHLFIRTQVNIDPVYFTFIPENYVTLTVIYIGAICHRYQRLRLLYGFQTM